MSSMSDTEQIQAHLARYCHLVDRATPEVISTLFWDDAVLEFNGPHRGLAAIRECFRQWIAEMRDPVENLRHLMYAPHIEIAGHRAEATCYFDADGRSLKKRTPILVRGLYRDRLEKRGEGWKFSERRIIVY